MSDISSRDPASSPADSTKAPLSARVLERVHRAELAASRRSASRLRRPRRSEALDGRSPEQLREARALRRVFLDLGDWYRDYRRRTGAAVSPEVRDAAYRFQKELNLAALVSVAASVDRLEALSW
jgi:hypothetical protein